MKKYVFLVKKAIKSEIEIEAENKADAFKKLVPLLTDDDDKFVKNIETEKQIFRFKLTDIIEENEEGKMEKKPYKRDEELIKIIEELEENDDDFRSNYRRLI